MTEDAEKMQSSQTIQNEVLARGIAKEVLAERTGNPATVGGKNGLFVAGGIVMKRTEASNESGKKEANWGE